MPNSESSESESEDEFSSEEKTDDDTAEEIPKDEEKLPLLDYEKQRLQRIEENNRRMEALGLRKMASNFTGSVLNAHQKKSHDGKGKRKIVDEDDEYNPTPEDDELSCSDDDDDDDEEEFSPSKKMKINKNSISPKKQGPFNLDSDFLDDDDALMQAIALSLQDTDTSGAHVTNPAPSANDERKGNPYVQDGSPKKGRKRDNTKENRSIQDGSVKKGRKWFDESGSGGFNLRDVQRLAATHDFTWSEKEIADMIYCFDSDGDGKISFDDFRKIIVRCNMLKVSENDATGKLMNLKSEHEHGNHHVGRDRIFL
ncbi:hypothetical protein OROGR_006313 [Orobanche gracilis]